MTFAVLTDSPASSGLAYHLLRAALDRYGVGPRHLDAAQWAVAERLAERALALESRVLATPEAARTTLGAARVGGALAEIAGRYETRAEFLADLAASGLDEDALAAAIGRELRFDAVMEGIAAGAPVPDSDAARAFYDAHPERFHRPERRQARHLLITVNPDFSENDAATAAGRARDLADRLKADPSRFEELARTHSECPSALEGGRLGVVPRGRLYESLDDCLFGLAAGEVAGPIETEIGFHVLMCESILVARVVPFVRAEPSLLDFLAARSRRAAQTSWLRTIGAVGGPRLGGREAVLESKAAADAPGGSDWTNWADNPPAPPRAPRPRG